jgi:hypothetical protein
MAVKETFIPEGFNYFNREQGIFQSAIVTVLCECFIMVAGYKSGRSMACKIAEFLGHRVFYTFAETGFFHVEPVTQAPDLIADPSFPTYIIYHLLHNIVLRIYEANMEVGQDKYPHDPLLKPTRWIIAIILR